VTTRTRKCSKRLEILEGREETEVVTEAAAAEAMAAGVMVVEDSKDRA
jgi:hypothetical protein